MPCLLTNTKRRRIIQKKKTLEEKSLAAWPRIFGPGDFVSFEINNPARKGENRRELSFVGPNERGGRKGHSVDRWNNE